MWRISYRLTTLLLAPFCRLEVDGVQHLPVEGGCVVACNHSFGPDYLLLGLASPRQIHYMAKSELFEGNRWLKRFLLGVGVFPIKRGLNDRVALQRAASLVESGCVLGMFPEGTRSTTGGLIRGRTGMVRIAAQAGAPVVPAVVIGSEAVFTRPLLKRALVRVRFGPPIDLSALGNSSGKSTIPVQRASERVMYAMAELLPFDKRGVYSDSSAVASNKSHLNGQSAAVDSEDVDGKHKSQE